MLIKCVRETVENEVKEQGGFLGILAATLGVNFLGNMLIGREAWAGAGTSIAGGKTIRTGEGQDF